MKSMTLSSIALLTLINGQALASTPDLNEVGRYLDTRVYNYVPGQVSAQLSRSSTADATNDPDAVEDGAYVNSNDVLKRLGINDKITPETTELLGESIDLSTGGLSFNHTDASIPGNSSLPVSFGRSFKGLQYSEYSSTPLADWTMSVPKISSVIIRDGAIYSLHWGAGKPCSAARELDIFGWEAHGVNAADYWNEDSISIPGGINEKLLNLGPDDADNNQIQLGEVNVVQRVTKSGWRATCFDITNASNNKVSEGFRFESPDGSVYVFDQLRLIEQRYGIKRKGRYTIDMMASKVTDRFGNSVTYHYNDKKQLTEIRGDEGTIDTSDDRVISFSYHIGGSLDGLLETATTNPDSTDARTWTYGYSANGVQGYSLSSVTRPDNNSWQFNLSQLGYYKPVPTMGRGNHQLLANQTKELDYCNNISQYHAANATEINTRPRVITATVQHPKGAIGSFTLTQTLHGRSNVDRERGQTLTSGAVGIDRINRCFNAYALTEKTLYIGVDGANSENTTQLNTDPTVKTEQWTYSYSSNLGFYDENDEGLGINPPAKTDTTYAVTGLDASYLTSAGISLNGLNYRKTQVVSPDGSKTVYYHNRDFTSELDGKLVLTLVYDTDGTTLMQSTYKDYSKQNSYGYSRRLLENTLPVYNDILNTETIIFDHSSSPAVRYYTIQSDFNDYNKPLLNTVYNSQDNQTKYTRTSFKHASDIWLLNLPSTTSVGYSTNALTQVSENTYYETATEAHKKWQVKEINQYGQLVRRYPEYHTDGNLKKVEFNVKIKDFTGTETTQNQFTQYDSYKRGKATLITIPNRYNAETKSVSLAVNDNGLVT